MVKGVCVKVCGITNLPDAELASSLGADYLGFIQYPKSPRYISLEKYRELLPSLPLTAKKVGVIVYSSMDELAAYKDAGFDYLQIHFPNDTPFFEVALWTELLPPHMMWLAPRVPPGRELDQSFLPLADYFLMDTFDPHHVGGSGKIGDWTNFKRLMGLYQKINWVLAGGLNPENIAEAVKQSGTKRVDVNSGIETAPGLKDHEKMRLFFENLSAAQA